MRLEHVCTARIIKFQTFFVLYGIDRAATPESISAELALKTTTPNTMPNGGTLILLILDLWAIL